MSSSSAQRTALRRALATTERQLYRKFKHAADFGVEGTANRQGVRKFKRAVRKFVGASDAKTVRGSYRGKPCFLTYREGSDIVVIHGLDGIFWSGWEMTADQLLTVKTRGSL